MPTLKNADGTINFYKMIRMNDHFENILLGMFKIYVILTLYIYFSKDHGEYR